MKMLQVLTEAGLEHIKEHQYKAGKYTPLDNLLNPYWIRMAEALPRWLAPNLVTLLGFFPLVVSYSLGAVVAPSFETPPPRWLMLFSTLALFVYQTMDALDGKQARRTGSSSPLGQLFDHGCDCLACLAQTGAAASLHHFGPNFLGLWSITILPSGFFLAQWEEYHTGTLPTSYGAVGVTETQYFLMAQTLGAALMGPERLHDMLVSDLKLPLLATSDLRTRFLQAWIIFLGFFMSLCVLKNLAYGLRKQGLKGAWAVSKDLCPVLLQNLLMACWHPEAVRLAAREISLLTSLNLFYFSAQMILYSMARMSFPVAQKWLLPYAVVVGVSRISPDLVRPLLLVQLVALVLWLAWWLVSVTDQLKRKLQIYMFTITSKYEDGKKSN